MLMRKTYKLDQENVGGRGHYVDHTGKRFGLLTAIKRTDNTIRQPNGRLERKWILQCDCGMYVTRTRQGLSKSKTCGNEECRKAYRIKTKQLKES